MCEIIGKHGPCGIVVGGRIDEIRGHTDQGSDNAKETLYDIFRMALADSELVMRLRFPGRKVRIVYDDSNYGKYIRRAFGGMKTDPGAASMRELFVECTPGDSIANPELQVADLLAYEGFKLLNDAGRSGNEMRAALRALLGSRTPIQITRFTDQNFQDLRRMIDNIKAGLSAAEGVTSKLDVSLGALEPMGLMINNE